MPSVYPASGAVLYSPRIGASLELTNERLGAQCPHSLRNLKRRRRMSSVATRERRDGELVDPAW